MDFVDEETGEAGIAMIPVPVDSGLDDAGQDFMPKLILLILQWVPGGVASSESIYMNSAGVTVIPPDYLLLHLPAVFVLNLLCGWLLAIIVLVTTVQEKGLICTPRFWKNFSTVFFGSLTPLLVIFLKVALSQWGEKSGFAIDDLLGLWEAGTLSAVELLTPCVLPMFVSVMVTKDVFEFAVAKACVFDIGNELDEHGLFPHGIKNLHEVFHYMLNNIKDEYGEPLTHFDNVPFVTEDAQEFTFLSHEYAEAWAIQQMGEQYPSEVIKIPSTSSVALHIFALLPAVTPYCWMRWTRPGEYLNSPCKSVQIVAVAAFLTLFIVIKKILVGAWKVWKSFGLVRCHLLFLLYLSANKTGRRYLSRLWRPDYTSRTFCNRDVSAIEEPCLSRAAGQKFATALGTVNPKRFQMATQSSQVRQRPSLSKIRAKVHAEETANTPRASAAARWKQPERALSGDESCISWKSSLAELNAEDEELDDLTDIFSKVRVLAFAKLKMPDRDSDSEGLKLTEEEKKEEEMEEWLKENSFYRFQILDVEKFINLRTCLKPSLLLARARLESTLVGSSVMAAICLMTVLTDFDINHKELGKLSCIGIMAAWLFFLFLVATVICVHAAVLMNMALLDSSVEVLRHWKTRTEAIASISQQVNHPKLRGTFSDYRLRLHSKLTALREPIENQIKAIQGEAPLKFAFIPITPQLRNRLILSVVATIFLTLGRSLSSTMIRDMELLKNSTAHE